MARTNFSAIALILSLAMHQPSNGQAVVSLEVDKINGMVLSDGPAATVTASPGDVLELIFRVRN